MWESGNELLDAAIKFVTIDGKVAPYGHWNSIYEFIINSNDKNLDIPGLPGLAEPLVATEALCVQLRRAEELGILEKVISLLLEIPDEDWYCDGPDSPEERYYDVKLKLQNIDEAEEHLRKEYDILLDRINIYSVFAKNSVEGSEKRLAEEKNKIKLVESMLTSISEWQNMSDKYLKELRRTY